MTATAEARQATAPSMNYGQRKRLSQSTCDRRKPLYQAVSAPLHNAFGARAAAFDCIKDDSFIDPCCGSGGMFVQSVKFIESHQGSTRDISIYGQEYTNTTYKLAKMNLAIRGISGNLGEQAANTFSNDQHKDLKADFIMANPPFNQKEWRADNELTDDPRWNGY